MSKTNRLAPLSTAALLVCGVASLSACHPTSHASAPSSLGVARTSADLERVVDEPGPIAVETVVGADWAVPRHGLINLDHPRAKAAKLVDGLEPIVVEFHAVRHPAFGMYLVDTGVERALRDDPEHAALHGIAADFLRVDTMRVRTDTASWIAAQKDPVRGVFLTHLHLDHVSGMRDVPSWATVYTGAGETAGTSLENIFVRGPIDAALEGKGDLREWPFVADRGGPFAAVVDVFGDATFWAISVPGHTRGTTAYLARTPDGPVLFTGDASHTAWGWDHGVEPGTYSEDGPRGAESLERLRAFAARHPRIDVRLGHQARPPSARAGASPTTVARDDAGLSGPAVAR